MTVFDPSQDPNVARARSAAYTLIGRSFQYPDGTLIAELDEPARWSTWPDLLDDSDGSASPPRGANPQIGNLIRAVRNAVRSQARAIVDPLNRATYNVERRYNDLFGHAVRGKCPAYELEYGQSEIIQQASELADLAGFYRAFGMEIVDRMNRRPDHITAECEFLAALCVKEAHAITQRDQQHVDTCANAQRAFLKDHLARWLPAFANRVDRADADGFYGAAARFAAAFIAAQCRRFEIAAGPPTLELRLPDPVLDRTIACGPGDCRAGQPGERLVQLAVDSEPQQER